MKTTIQLALALMISLSGLGYASAYDQKQTAGTPPTCSSHGAPPMRTVQPVTKVPSCSKGKVLSFEQNGVTRYACLNLPRQSEQEINRASTRQWPLLVYLHGSLTTPDSLYRAGRNLFSLHDEYPLSGDAEVKGFIVLSPEGRRAEAWPSESAHTGKGFHWDEWHRDPATNLDAQAIDRFIEKTIATGKVDSKRIYVFGWSNGAYMATLYGMWRSDRIAAIGQYAGADPWSRTPCPVAMTSERKVPIVTIRNLCDALVPCASTSAWSSALTEQQWPFKLQSLDWKGAPSDAECSATCSKAKGLYEHVRWPEKAVLKDSLLAFLKQYTLP